MNKQNDGGPAFPLAFQEIDGDGIYAHDGMTLRDWFAGQALAGIASDPDTVGGHAAWCYRIADEMLAQRAMTETKGD